MKAPEGYIIAIEGIDAVGKNTQSALLSRWLSKRGVRVTRMSFPDYRTAIGKEIRCFLSGKKAYPPELQHLLFAANRWEKRGEILERLRAGETMIVNRYTPSNLAYGVANGLDADWLASLEMGLPEPDLVIVLDAPVPSLASRRPGRGKDEYEKSAPLQRRAQKAYRELARKYGWKLIDANAQVAGVQAIIDKFVGDALGSGRGIST